MLTLCGTLVSCDKCGCDANAEPHDSKQASGIAIVCDTAWGEETIVEF